jgi:L-threonylcarbamoyladenylate synthase
MNEIVKLLRQDAVGVLPTDTLYGIVTSAFSKRSVERIYEIKGRDDHKPFIILISSLADLKKFGIAVTPEQKKFLAAVWPGPVSVILPCKQKKFSYLHRGSNSLAIRFPADRLLQAIIKKTGPLVAPSANPQGKQPAETSAAAQAYFEDAVDFYVSGSKKAGKASTIVDFTESIPRLIRQGSKKIPKSYLTS